MGKREVEPSPNLCTWNLLARLRQHNVKRMTQGDMVDDAAWEGRFAAIEKEADHILKTEGEHHVNGTYFVQAGDAHMSRMLEAERIVAKRDESMDRYRAKPLTEKVDAFIGLSDAELALRMVQHTARVCSLVTDAMGIKP